MTNDDVETFEQHRSTLMGLAYRVLGSTADAADAVQDTYVAWLQADKDAIRSPGAWLTTVCTRRSIDLATAANRARVSYVGTWLPDFVHTSSEDDPGDHAALASSVTTAFLLLLDRLTPKERAAYLLREVFDRSYAEVASALGMQEPACRQLVARARRNVGRPDVRHHTPRERQQDLLRAFRRAVAAGSTDALARLLADDVALHADSGGKVPTIRETLHGRDAVVAFVESTIGPSWRQHVLQDAEINATFGLELVDHDRVTAAVSFAFDQTGQVSDIFIMRNPDKLARLDAAHLN
ncbi:MAG TPA: RNA polymerase sigma factor SigJ [Acidimicrobiales bacterium]|nr:RNA polymerase sigma factor SigJ [Acidimicrobiales bacterium]